MPVIDLGRVIGPQGPQGDTGAQGIRGEQGLPGPNQVTNSTVTPLTGVLTGNGSVVGVENIDAAPTADSTGFARSGGTDKAIKGRVPVYGKGVNLLRNWYFAGGGTGRGVFPVNQRGATSGTTVNNTYSIDGWKWTYGSSIGTWSLVSGGISVSPSRSDNAVLFQELGNLDSLLNGEKVTASVLYADGQFASGSITRNSGTSQIFASIDGTWVLGMVSNSLRLRFNTTKTAVAVKFELGTEQTLCHNEGTDANPVWVLNDVPDYEYELYRCMTSTADSTDTFANKSLATGQEIAYVENDTTATKTNGYAVGEYFCWHGSLYLAKTAIGNGDTFTENTNCEQVTEGGFNSLRSVTVNPLTIEATSYITNINQCRAYTVGRIAYVFISCQIEATPVALINLIKGIPRPYGNTLLPFSSATSSGTTFALAVSVENGVAYIRKGSNNATTAGWYTGTISYPIA